MVAHDRELVGRASEAVAMDLDAEVTVIVHP